jgi:hypothetical protein
MSDFPAPLRSQVEAPPEPKIEPVPPQPVPTPDKPVGIGSEAGKDEIERPTEPPDKGESDVIAKPEESEATENPEEEPVAQAGAERDEGKEGDQGISIEVPSSAKAALTARERSELLYQREREALFGKRRDHKPQKNANEKEAKGRSTVEPGDHPKERRDAKPSGSLESLSQLEELLSTTKEILKVLSEKSSPKPFDIERDAPDLAYKPNYPESNKILHIDQPWNLTQTNSALSFGINHCTQPLSTLEALVAEADQHSTTLQQFSDEIAKIRSSTPAVFKKQVWMVKRLVVLRCLKDTKILKDEKSLRARAESMRSWLLALMVSLEAFVDYFQEQTVEDLGTLVVSMVRYHQYPNLQIGHIILQGWDDGVLKDPCPLRNLSESQREDLLFLIAKAECVLNFTSEVDAISVDRSEVRLLVQGLSLSELLAVDVHRLWPVWMKENRYPMNDVDREIRGLDSQVTDPNSQTVKALGALIKERDFEKDDLNIERLKSIGGLTIQWTRFYDQHLFLDKSSKTLLVSWFAAPPSGIPQTGDLDPISQWYNDNLESNLCPDAGNALRKYNRELFITWIILFSSSDSEEELMKAYYNIKLPAWLPPLGKSKKTMATIMDPELRSQNPMIDYHLGKGAEVQPFKNRISNAQRINYSEFPIFEHRLRTLRAYMDRAKPRGLLQLWRDNRDSLAYYTFWSAVTFGCMALLLTFFSLAVSVSQTVAAFKALHLPSSG